MVRVPGRGAHAVASVGHFDVEQRTVLLAAEDVPIARAAARPLAVERELDGVRGIERDGGIPRCSPCRRPRLSNQLPR